jgi:leucyl-tRNA synthetase
MLAYTPGRRPRAEEDVKSEEDDERVIDWIVLKPEERGAFPQDQIVWRWARMSKSKGNVVSPDDVCERYGADSLRVYEMFVAPFEDNVQWNDEGINGSFRFINRLWRWGTAALSEYQSNRTYPTHPSESSRRIRRKLHQTIRKVSADLDGFRFNTAIAALMELVNDLYAYRPIEGSPSADGAIVSEAMESLVLLMAPFTPHLSDELWERLGHPGSTYRANWPNYDESVAADEEITLVIQVNGKLRDRLTVPADTTDEAIKQMALANEKVTEMLNGKQVKNVVVVPKRLVNVVIG